MDFMTYQLRRTTITTFVHLSLPLLYCVGLSLIDPLVYTVSPSPLNCTWYVYNMAFTVSPSLNVYVAFAVSVGSCVYSVQRPHYRLEIKHQLIEF